MADFNPILLSYSRKDQAFAKRIIDSLERKGVGAWVDWKNISPSTDWKNEIWKGIEKADNFVCLVSPAYFSSKMCNEELQYALKLQKKIIPVVRKEVRDKNNIYVSELKEALFDSPIRDIATKNEEALNKLNYIFIRRKDNFDCEELLGKASDPECDGVDSDIEDFDTSFNQLFNTILEDPNQKAEQSRIINRAAEWTRYNKDRSYLLKGIELTKAQRWLIQTKSAFQTDLLKEYISAGIANSAKEARRLQITAITLAILLVVAIGFLLFAIDRQQQASQQAKINLVRQLAAQAINFAQRSPDLAFLLSLEANRIAITSAPGVMAEARDSLLRSIQTNPTISSILHGHESAVWSVQFSPDGSTMASGSSDKKVFLWDVFTGSIKKKLLGHRGAIHAITFSPDGKLLASSGCVYSDTPAPVCTINSEIWLWDVSSGQGTKLFTNPTYAISSLIFTRDGNYLISTGCSRIRSTGECQGGLDQGGSDGEIDIWDMKAHTIRRKILVAESIYDAKITDDNNTVIVLTCEREVWGGCANGRVLIVNYESGETIRELHLHIDNEEYIPRNIAVNIDNRLLAVANNQAPILWLDLANQTSSPTLINSLNPQTQLVRALAFSVQADLFASGGADSTINVWDGEGHKIDELRGHESAVNNLSFSPDGKILASASGDNTIRLWNMTMENRLNTMLGIEEVTNDRINFTDQGKLLVSDYNDYNCRNSSNYMFFSSSDTELISRTGQCKIVDLTGRIELAPNRIDIWDILKKSRIAKYRGFGISPDLTTIASYVDNSHFGFRLWDIQTGMPKSSILEGHKAIIYEMVFHPDGKSIITTSWDGSVRRWDLKTGLPDVLFQATNNEEAWEVAISPNGKWLAFNIGSGTSEFQAFLFNLNTRDLISFPSAKGGASATVTFSRDNKYFAFAGSDRTTIYVWDLEKQTYVGNPLKGHTHPMIDLKFGPDSNILASASQDLEMRLWDIERSQPIAEPFQATSSVGSNLGGQLTTMAFSQNGGSIAVGSVDGRIWIWDLDLESLKHRACRIANRNLTQQEWNEYLPSEAYHATCPKIP